MNLKCIIFDVDGTMADTERDGHRIAFNLAFVEFGLKWHWDEELYGLLLAVTGGKERVKYYQSHFLAKTELTDDQIKQLHTYKTKHYIKLLESGEIPLRKGVKILIKNARDENIRLAISTTTTPVNVSTLLHYTMGDSAVGFFSVIAAGDVVTNKKPAADIYLYALNKLKLHASQCIAIEDSQAGLESAVNAGIKTIVITNDYTKQQDFSKAVDVYPNFNKININLLQNIIGDNHV